MTKKDELLKFKKFIKGVSDDKIWEAFTDDPELIKYFDGLIKQIKDSVNWPKEDNHKKGALLEELVNFIASRFVIIESVEKNQRTTDNEIDIDLNFNEHTSPPFIVDNKCKFICECKNVKSKSIDVGQVVKLVDLCKLNRAGLGVFISIKGLGGAKWKFAEGKRKKLWLIEKIAIISFTLNEIERLKEPDVNFYTLIKAKYKLLIDEVDNDMPVISKSKSKDDPDFPSHLKQVILTLRKFNFIDDNEVKTIHSRVKEKYGDDFEI